MLFSLLQLSSSELIIFHIHIKIEHVKYKVDMLKYSYAITLFRENFRDGHLGRRHNCLAGFASFRDVGRAKADF